MATFLDITLLQGTQLIFAFILIWVMVFAVLSQTKWLGEKKESLYALLALAIALLTIFAPAVTQIIIIIVPWFSLLLIGAVLLIIILMSIGYTKENILDTLTGDNYGTTIVYWVLIIAIIIIVSAIGVSFPFFSGEGEPSTGTNATAGQDGLLDGDVDQRGADALFATIFHPKVLGLVLVLLIGTFLVQLLGRGTIA